MKEDKKMQVIVDVIPEDGRSMYDAKIGEYVNIAKPKGRSSKKCTKEGRILVPVYKITPELLRSTAETLEYAERNGLFLACVVIKDGKLGLVCA